MHLIGTDKTITNDADEIKFDSSLFENTGFYMIHVTTKKIAERDNKNYFNFLVPLSH